MSNRGEECPICYERTAVIKYMVTSPCCGGKACRDCYLTYLLGGTVHSCMYTQDCGALFTRKTLYQMFKKVDCDKLLKHAAELLFEVEQQHIVKYHDLKALQRARAHLQEMIRSSSIWLDTALKPSNPSNMDSVSTFLESSTDEKIDEAIAVYKKHMKTVKAAYEEYNNINKAYTAKYGGIGDEEDEDVQKILKKGYMSSVRCQVDGCGGYTDISWTCIKCGSIVCKRCGEVEKKYISRNQREIARDTKREDYDLDSTVSGGDTDEEEDGTVHVCREDDIKSFKQILLSARPCPNCKTFIYKISGCNDMWCTTCNTGFRWNTMKPITKEHFHNPHRAEYMKRMKELGIDVSTVSDTSEDGWVQYGQLREKSASLSEMCRFMHRYREVCDNMIVTYDSLTNEKARLKYIEGSIDRKRFISICRTNMTKLDKARDERAVLENMCMSINEHLKQYLNGELSKRQSYEYCIDAINSANEQLQDMRRIKLYNTVRTISTDELSYIQKIEKIPDTYHSSDSGKVKHTDKMKDADSAAVVIELNI